MRGFHNDEDTNNPVFYAASLSGFGFMWNIDSLRDEGLKTPKTFEDLLDPQYHGHIVMCSPQYSNSTTVSVLGLTQYLTRKVGWENALTFWANLTGNVGLYVNDSEEVPKLVYSGEYSVGICIDKNAFEIMIMEAAFTHPHVIGFSYWPTTVSPDCVAILKGALNLGEAKLFMDYITSQRGQNAVVAL